MSFLILVGYNIFSTKAMMQVEKFSSKLLFSIRHKHFKRFGCIAFTVMALFAKDLHEEFVKTSLQPLNLNTALIMVKC